MNRLWVRLALAFALVSALSVSMAALLANNQVAAQFARYLSQNRVAELGLVEQLQEAYARDGNLGGASAILNASQPGRSAGAGRGGARAELIVADAAGQIVAATSERSGALTETERNLAVAVMAQDKLIGYAISQTPANTQVAQAAQTFVSQINQSLWQAALLAAFTGAGLGFFISRGVAGPLAALAQAARRVAQGKLDENVNAQGTREVRQVSHAFNEMTRHLRLAEQERQKSEQLRRNMVADIAHELRAPLTVMQGNLQAVLDDVYPLSKQEIATIYDETIVLGRLVNDLRELSLAEAGQLELNLIDAPVEPLARAAVARFRELFETKGVALDVALEDGLPHAKYDPDRAAQALNNLLSNALRHTPAGGRVVVDVARDGAAARVSVRDTGAGIAPEDVPHVFDRFWRADKSRARAGGSGLGLAIAKQFAQAWGGQMGVSSQPGKGSEFWFTLPAASG